MMSHHLQFELPEIKYLGFPQRVSFSQIFWWLRQSLPAVQETWVRSLVRKILWRRKWQRTPGFLPGKSHGWRSLAGHSSWCHKESNMTKQLRHTVEKSFWFELLAFLLNASPSAPVPGSQRWSGPPLTVTLCLPSPCFLSFPLSLHFFSALFTIFWKLVFFDCRINQLIFSSGLYSWSLPFLE